MVDYPKPPTEVISLATGLVAAKFTQYEYDKAIAFVKEKNGIKAEFKLKKVPLDERAWREQWYKLQYNDSMPYSIPYQTRAIYDLSNKLQLHNAKEENISFFANDEDRLTFKVTTMKFGAMLEKFFSHLLNKEEIRDMATKYYAEHKAIEPLWAKTPEEIEDVFLRCRWGSCATAKFDVIHQAQVYGAGDVAIAYTEKGDGHVAARVTCYPEKKVYAGEYGAYQPILMYLLKEGYKRHPNAGFNGAKLKKIVQVSYYTSGWDHASKVGKKLITDKPKYIGAHIDYFSEATDKGEYLEADHVGNIHFRYRDFVPNWKITPGGLWVDINGRELSREEQEHYYDAVKEAPSKKAA